MSIWVKGVLGCNWNIITPEGKRLYENNVFSPCRFWQIPNRSRFLINGCNLAWHHLHMTCVLASVNTNLMRLNCSVPWSQTLPLLIPHREITPQQTPLGLAWSAYLPLERWPGQLGSALLVVATPAPTTSCGWLVGILTWQGSRRGFFMQQKQWQWFAFFTW